MGKSKYETPQWRNAPIRAQINEALREVEQVKAAWRDLLRIADTLDEIHRNVIKQKRVDLGKSLAYLKVANGAYLTAGKELKRLEGWMISLCESELGLHAMLSPSFGEPRWFQQERNEKMSQQAQRWTHLRETSWHTPNAL